MWTGRGEEVPVTLGNSKCSSEGEEIMRVRRSMILLDTSGSFENSDDELRVSTSDSSSSEPESIHFVWDGGIVRYLDDEIINRQGGEEEYELRVSTPDSSSSEPDIIHSMWDSGMVKYLDNEVINHQGVEEEYSQNQQVERGVHDDDNIVVHDDDNGIAQLSLDSNRVGDSIRIDGGGGTRSIVGEGITMDQQLLGSGVDLLVGSEGMEAIGERLESVPGVCVNVKDNQSSSGGSAQSKVNL